MKNTFLIMMGLLISFAAFTQTYDYKSAWESVKRYQTERKPESAIKVLKDIEQAAIREDNKAQHLKVFGIMPGIIVQDNDNKATVHIDYLLENIASFKSPQKQIGHLVIFHYLMEHYQQNQYLIQDRTNLNNEIPQDIQEWSPENYEGALLMHLENAMKNHNDLLVPVEDYNAILNEYNIAGSGLRPYLLDVVVFRIMGLLQNPLLSASDFHSEVNMRKFFDPWNEFLDYDIPADFSKGRILNLYQTILKIHSEKGEERALLDADIHRIKYVHAIINTIENDSLYLIGLQNLKESHNFPGASTIIEIEKAQYLFSTSYQEGKQKRKKEAYDLLNEIISADSNNPHAQNLLNRITQKQYNVTNRQVYSCKEGININIVSANINKLNYTIVRIPDEPKVFYRKDREQVKDYIKSLDKIDSGNLSIEVGEYFEETHNEFSLDNPGSGYYAIYFNHNDGFYYSTFYVSDLAYIVKQKGNLEIIVADRISGQPVENASVQFYLNVYDRATRSNQNKLVSTLQTDKNGKVDFAAHNLNGSLNISVQKGKDKIFLEDSYYIYDSPNLQENDRSEAFILTDRAMYRPGQTVHFKAILIGYDGLIPSVEQKEKIVVTLRDANGSEVSSKTLVSNDFGSVASSFSLPSSGLTGNFSLVVSASRYQGYKQIQVEEYRRPKFEVLLEKPTESFSLEDSITFQGKAVSYASVPISDAEVSYNVYRRERRWWWSYFHSSGDAEILITSGKTKSNDEGVFLVDFVAKGEVNNSYIFRLEVDVLDLSGETRSAVEEIIVSGKPFVLSVDAVSLLDKADSTKLIYSVQNNAGEEIKMPTSYLITLLEDPGYIVDVMENQRHRSADRIIDVLKKWKEKGVVKSEYKAGENRQVDLSALKAGGYKIEIYAGDQTFTKYLAITDRKKKVYPFVQAVFVHLEKDIYTPGEKARFIFGTPYDQLNIFIEEERSDHKQVGKWLKIGNQRIVDLLVSEKDYGGFGIKYWAIKNNKIVSDSKVVAVPWNHKNLEISYSSFRDNLLPGQEEKWIIKISGNDKEGLAAELCAALYDMSLDQFRINEWNWNFYPSFRFNDYWRIVGFDMVNGRQLYYEWNKLDNKTISPIIYPEFDLFEEYRTQMMVRGRASGVMLNEMSNAPAPETMEAESAMSKVSDQDVMNTQNDDEQIEKKAIEQKVQIRQNLEETVFFMPQLKTDEDGNVILEFKMGEALTKWKLLLFAHDQELRFAFDKKEIVTKKDLMVIPYAPRFLRQGDKIAFSGKVSNLGAKELSVDVHLKILNALSGKDITDLFHNNLESKKLQITSGGSEAVSFNLYVPEDFIDPIEYNLIAEAGNFSDGESGTLPVITNKIYVTETRAFSLSSGEKYTFNISDLIKNGTPISLGFDYTAHPVWSVIQALPTLNDYPHECTEQLLNKYFAQALGNKILTAIPNIENIIEEWMKPESTALLSNLEKNNEFKSTTLENTPWVMDARNETEQKRALGRFLDKNALHYNKIQLLEKLVASQNIDGGFPWFRGGRSNLYITQYLLENIARMENLGLVSINESGLDLLVAQAINYIDEEAKHRYDELLKLSQEQKIKMEEDHVRPIDLHYLFVKNLLGLQSTQMPEYYDYYYNQAYKYWANKSDMSRAFIAKVAFKNNRKKVVESIMESFNQRVLSHPDLGAYWKAPSSYYWYQLPIETHTAILELYQEVDENNPLIQEMQLWLLNHKRTNAWPTTKSTASAIYALLKAKNGNLVNWTSSGIPPEIVINDTKWEEKSETASGYIQKNWNGDEAKNLRSIRVVNNNNNIAWGGLYLRFLSPIDEIAADQQRSIAVSKALFIKRTKSGKEQLVPVAESNVKVGEKLVSRIIINTDRDMSFLHLKDMRASGLEPINVISNYKWSGGIGYYESTKDVATHFFIDYLPKGKYVFEYELRISHAGEFTNGITTLQSMYAPEFSAHSSASGLTVE